MNAEKARELFSEYREGSLSPALRSTLEQAMASDASVRRDYDQFDALLNDLESAATVEAELPFDLHDRIMARVDKSVFDAKRTRKASWFSTYRTVLVGGVACLALVTAVVSIQNRAGGPSTAGLSQGASSTLNLAVEGKDLRVRHEKASSALVINDDASGQVVERFDLAKGPVDAPLTNSGDSAIVLRIESGDESVLIAVPGSGRIGPVDGQGSVKDLARAIADRYKEPVRIFSSDPTQEVAWSLGTTNPQETKAVKGSFSVERRSGLLSLVD